MTKEYRVNMKRSKKTEAKKPSLRAIRVYTALLFLVVFTVLNGLVHVQLWNQRSSEQLNAAYTAESTVARIQAQLNRYLAKEDVLKRLVEGGSYTGESEFRQLAEAMTDEDGVITAIELAPAGIISQVYPLQGNEAAVGLNLFEAQERKAHADLARDSGRYVVGGPFELVQGGLGALLYDPIYTEDSGTKRFWGFALLVIDWDKFVDGLELDKLEDASYRYKIWKTDITTGEEVVIAQCDNPKLSDALEVVCDVPNDQWHFEIAMVGGWYSKAQFVIGFILSALIALLSSVIYWQYAMRRRRDAEHAEALERSAKEAREANEAKTRFLFNMSHDIRTPMNAIIGFSELLEKHIGEREKALNYVEKIRASGNFLLSLINYVLEMARIESGKLSLREEVVSVTSFVNALTAVFEPETEKKHLTYRVHSDVQHEYLIGDRTKTREIFLNIIGNAIKYTPENGTITVEITELPAGENKALLKVVVQDTGIGMSKEYLPHIFEAFTREHTSTETRVTGTGLGLPIVKSIVDLMGGRIKVESTEHVGTKVTVELAFPIADENAVKNMKSCEAETAARTLHGKRLLVAEDNDLNAEIAEAVLNENGILTDRAEDGKKCLAMLKAAPEGYYDAILMDIQMPNMNGYEAAKEIRKSSGRRGRIPIIAMTANAFEEDRRRAMESGMNAHLAKPIDTEVMFRVLRENLE